MSFEQLYFSFNGRISRQTYWLNGVLVLGGIGVFVVILDSIVRADGALWMIYSLLAAWPSLAIQAKRWHDRGKPGAWILINFIPLVGALWSVVELGFLEGTLGENRFGPNPVGSRIGQAQVVPFTSNTMLTSGSSAGLTSAIHPLPGPVATRLVQAKQLQEEGLLNEEEYQQIKQRILVEA